MNRTALKEILITINFAIAHYNFVAELATIYWYWKIENKTLKKKNYYVLCLQFLKSVIHGQ